MASEQCCKPCLKSEIRNETHIRFTWISDKRHVQILRLLYYTGVSRM